MWTCARSATTWRPTRWVLVPASTPRRPSPSPHTPGRCGVGYQGFQGCARSGHYLAAGEVSGLKKARPLPAVHPFAGRPSHPPTLPCTTRPPALPLSSSTDLHGSVHRQCRLAHWCDAGGCRAGWCVVDGGQLGSSWTSGDGPAAAAGLKRRTSGQPTRNQQRAHQHVQHRLGASNSAPSRRNGLFCCAPCPALLPQVGLHERSAREKIRLGASNSVAHVMNDEATRKFIQVGGWVWLGVAGWVGGWGDGWVGGGWRA